MERPRDLEIEILRFAQNDDTKQHPGQSAQGVIARSSPGGRRSNLGLHAATNCEIAALRSQ